VHLTIRVLLHERQALVREALGLILRRHEDVEVVGETDSLAESLALARQLRPRVALLDAEAARNDVVDAIAAIIARSPETRVLIRARTASEEDLYAAVRGGASGYLLGDSDSDQLLAALRAVANGGAYLPPALTRRVLDDLLLVFPGSDRPRLADLTGQELEVLRLLALGNSNAELGRALFLSESTIKTHLSNMFRKLDVRDRVQAVIAAYDARLVTPGSRDERPGPTEPVEQGRLALV